MSVGDLVCRLCGRDLFLIAQVRKYYSSTDIEVRRAGLKRGTRHAVSPLLLLRTVRGS